MNRCSICGHSRNDTHYMWVPAIEEMAADLGRPVEVKDLAAFTRCGRHAGDYNWYPLSGTIRLMEQQKAQKTVSAKKAQKTKNKKNPSNEKNAFNQRMRGQNTPRP